MILHYWLSSTINGSWYVIHDSSGDGIGLALLQEDPSDDESGGPAVTSQPASSSVFAVSLPTDSNATENTSLNPQDKVTYTPGN
jgi:hypothetical protein